MYSIFRGLFKSSAVVKVMKFKILQKPTKCTICNSLLYYIKTLKLKIKYSTWFGHCRIIISDYAINSYV